ncbi:unnamed protein product, partial [marine sediment metagenome]
MGNSELPNQGRDRDGEIDRDRDIDREERERENISIFNILLFHYQKNNNNNVAGWIRKTLANSKGEKVLSYIHKKKVYTVSVLRRIQGLDTSTVYGIHKELEERLIVKKTGFYAINENPRKAGRRPEFYALADIDIKDPDHDLICEAQDRYDEAEIKYDKGLQEEYSDNIRIKEIITEISEYYLSRGSIGQNRPSIKNVLQYLRANYPDL